MAIDGLELARLHVAGDHLRVELNRVAEDLAEARRLQAEVVARADAAGVIKVMFDYRRVGTHADDVREEMWKWASGNPFVAMALLVSNDLVRVRMNMTAVAQRVRMRAFLHEHDALGWLDGAERRRPTTESPKQS